MTNKELEVKIETLPDELKREVCDYIEYLSNKYPADGGKAGKFNYRWQSCLAGLKATSVELQHRAAGWR